MAVVLRPAGLYGDVTVDDGEDLVDFIDLAANGRPPCRVARRLRPARGAGAGAGAGRPGIVWLGGFKSDMRGSKASFLDDWARRQGRALLRFDYFGHGESDGRFEDFAIGDWLEQSLTMIAASTRGPQILVGASMGGWIALLAARRLAAKGEPPHALVLIAPAVDFTEELIWKAADEAIRRAILEEGVWRRPSPYSPEPTPITRRLVEEGRDHLMLGGVVRAHAPVHILQGRLDEDVPFDHAIRLVDCLVADPVVLSVVMDGDHRLSREQDMAQLVATIESLG